MKIDITKKQYWDLMRAMYIADWTANAVCDVEAKEDDGIKEIRDYIFSFAKEMGCEEYAKYDEDDGKYYATFKLDDEPSTRALIERYDDHIVWEELVEWLGDRDFIEKYTQEEIEKMDDEERFVKHMELCISWEKEFEKHGVKRLGVDEKK